MPGYRSPSRKKAAAKARKGKSSASRKGSAPKIAAKMVKVRQEMREAQMQNAAAVASTKKRTEGKKGHRGPKGVPPKPRSAESPLGTLPVMDLGTANTTETQQTPVAPVPTVVPFPVGEPPKVRYDKKEREKIAYNLRIAGHDYRTIAEHLGVSVKTAYFDVQSAAQYLREHERVLAEDVKAIIISRNDAMIAYLWPKVELGDTFAVREVRGIHQDTAKLLGLNAPEQIDLNVRRPLREASSEELRQLAERLGQARPIPSSVLSTSRPLRLIDGKTGQPVTNHFTDDQETETTDADT